MLSYCLFNISILRSVAKLVHDFRLVGESMRVFAKHFLLLSISLNIQKKSYTALGPFSNFHISHVVPNRVPDSISNPIQTKSYGGLRPGVNKKPRKFKIVWHGFWVILKLSGRANQPTLKLSAGFSNMVCWTSYMCFCFANCLIRLLF